MAELMVATVVAFVAVVTLDGWKVVSLRRAVRAHAHQAAIEARFQ